MLQEKVRERHATSEREAAQQMALEGERENNQRLQRDETAAGLMWSPPSARRWSRSPAAT